MTISYKRVWDTFLFSDELDLLECRLTELDDAVYRHVLVESPVTHQGDPKPLYFQENKERFSPWKDKIIHVIADPPPEDATPVQRENGQRDYTWKGLEKYRSGIDILLHGDVDEIPRAEIVQDLDGHVAAMRLHMLAVNLLDPGWWPGTTGSSAACSMNSMRDSRFGVPHGTVIYDAGWHFSWLGGPEGIMRKVHTIYHTEMIPRIESLAGGMYKEKINPREAEGARYLVLTEIDGSWPKYMQERRGPAIWYWPGE